MTPRQSVTEVISQSSTVFPPAEVSCHSFPQVLYAAQHTWDDDSHRAREVDRWFRTASARYRSGQGESVIPVNTLEIPPLLCLKLVLGFFLFFWYFCLWIIQSTEKYKLSSRSCVQRSSWRSLETQKSSRCPLQPFVQMGASVLVWNTALISNLERRSVSSPCITLFIVNLLQAMHQPICVALCREFCLFPFPFRLSILVILSDPCFEFFLHLHLFTVLLRSSYSLCFHFGFTSCPALINFNYCCVSNISLSISLTN